MSMEITGDLLIGGRQIPRSERQPWAVNPVTGEVLRPHFVEAQGADVDLAAQLAARAFDDFRNAPLETRAGLLVRIAEKLEALGWDLIDRVHAETAIPTARLEAERNRTVLQLRLFASVVRERHFFDYTIDPGSPERVPSPKPDLRLRQIPVGPVAVFGSSNFPLAFSVAGGDTASALAAGCPVIVKGHPAHPGTSEMVGRVIQEAVRELGLPEGVFSLLTGGISAGAALVGHPLVKAVGFTGSRKGGMALVNLAAVRSEPIPVFAEMSSVNPVFLLPAALEDRAEALGQAYVGSLTVSGGQLCTNPGVVVALPGRALDRFMASASAALQGIMAPAMLSEGIHAAFDAGVEAFSKHPDVQIAARGIATGEVNCTPGAIFTTTAAMFVASPSLRHEVFGASSIVVRCLSIDEMGQVLDCLEGQLTATVHADAADYAAARMLLPKFERKAGRIILNGWPTGVEVSPGMVHGGPFPATSDSRFTSVGTSAIRRFLRPVCYQDFPAALLPEELSGGNE